MVSRLLVCVHLRMIFRRSFPKDGDILHDSWYLRPSQICHDCRRQTQKVSRLECCNALIFCEIMRPFLNDSKRWFSTARIFFLELLLCQQEPSFKSIVSVPIYSAAVPCSDMRLLDRMPGLSRELILFLPTETDFCTVVVGVPALTLFLPYSQDLKLMKLLIRS